MRIIYLILLYTLFNNVLFSQKKEPINSKLILTELIKTRVMLIDTTSPASISYLHGNDKNSLPNYLNLTAITYLERTKFNQLINSLMVLAYNKNVVITNWLNGNKKLSIEKIKESYTVCDSILQMRCWGGEDTMLWACDSTSRFMDVRAIDFYEKWNYNKHNGMIEKEVIAYTPLSFDSFKEYFRELFTIFKEEKYVQEISEKQ